MRSSNKRSRSKNNRNRPSSGGNIVNRVFDSSGPEGKVRGTPQQIIDKYNQLTRDAQLSGDRVNAENFAQHAEHYTRMLAEAQREMDQRREQQDQGQNRQQNDQQGQNRQQNDQQGQNRQQHDQQNRQDDSGPTERDAPRQPEEARQSEAQPEAETADAQGETPARKPRNRRKPAPKPNDAPRADDDVIDTGSEDRGGLVETPEDAPKPRRTRSPRKTAPDAASSDGPRDGGANEPVE